MTRILTGARVLVIRTFLSTIADRIDKHYQIFELVQILPPLLHLHFLRPLIVVLREDLSANVHPLTDNLWRNVVPQVLRNAPTPDRMGICSFATATATVTLTVGTLLVKRVRSGNVVDAAPKTRDTHSAMATREQRFSAVLVSDVLAHVS